MGRIKLVSGEAKSGIGVACELIAFEYFQGQLAASSCLGHGFYLGEQQRAQLMATKRLGNKDIMNIDQRFALKRRKSPEAVDQSGGFGVHVAQQAERLRNLRKCLGQVLTNGFGQLRGAAHRIVCISVQQRHQIARVVFVQVVNGQQLRVS